ncbi:MAG: response regulator [Candidatus Omnitrophica bacterium]|nr:response regulator [Candidatus Omnitrophota bacterium]
MRKQAILVIDDEEDICWYTKTILEKTGKFDVIYSTNGEQGINLAKTTLPDLVILDVNMPFIDGGEVAAILRADELTKHIPIIFLTALLKKEEEINLAQQGSKKVFLAKPITAVQLIEKIEECLGNK